VCVLVCSCFLFCLIVFFCVLVVYGVGVAIVVCLLLFFFLYCSDMCVAVVHYFAFVFACIVLYIAVLLFV